MTLASKGVRILLCIITLFLVIGIRIPLLDKTLFGEEGNFASFIAYPIISQVKINSNITENSNVASSQFIQGCLLLVGRIDGSDIKISPGRNLMPYCLINKIFNPLIGPYWRTSQTFDEKTKLARITFLGISSIGFIAALFICYLVSLRLTGWSVVLPHLIVMYAGTTHLLVGSSIQPQLDGTIGVALLCSSYLLMYLGIYVLSNNKWRFFLLMLSAMLIAFGKNEWPIVFLVAIIGSMTFYFCTNIIIRKFINPTSIDFSQAKISKERLAFEVTPLLLGILLGVIVCIFLSPEDYISGYSLIGNIASKQYTSWNLVSSYQDILMPLGVFIGAAILLTYSQFRFSIQVFDYLPFIYFLLSLGITIGFIYSGYLGDGFPRYFAPSLMLLVMYCVTLLPGALYRLNRIWLAPIVVVLMFSIYKNYQIIDVYRTTSISITVPGDTNWKKNDLVSAAKLSKENPNQVYLIDASIIYYYPNVNFISSDMGKLAAEEILKNYKNKILVLE